MKTWLPTEPFVVSLSSGRLRSAFSPPQGKARVQGTYSLLSGLSPRDTGKGGGASNEAETSGQAPA